MYQHGWYLDNLDSPLRSSTCFSFSGSTCFIHQATDVWEKHENSPNVPKVSKTGGSETMDKLSDTTQEHKEHSTEGPTSRKQKIQILSYRHTYQQISTHTHGLRRTPWQNYRASNSHKVDDWLSSTPVNCLPSNLLSLHPPCHRQRRSLATWHKRTHPEWEAGWVKQWEMVDEWQDGDWGGWQWVGRVGERQRERERMKWMDSH